MCSVTNALLNRQKRACSVFNALPNHQKIICSITNALQYRTEEGNTTFVRQRLLSESTIFLCLKEYLKFGTQKFAQTCPDNPSYSHLTIWKVSRKSYCNMSTVELYALVPLQTTDLEIFSCV